MAKFELDIEIDHWINGAAHFRQKWADLAVTDIDKAMQTAFRIADQRVHVITGYLKSTGRYETNVVDDGEIEGRLIYEADYAIYEFGRGGEHDAMTPAVMEISDQFLVAMIDAAEATVRTWR